MTNIFYVGHGPDSTRVTAQQCERSFTVRKAVRVARAGIIWTSFYFMCGVMVSLWFRGKFANSSPPTTAELALPPRFTVLIM